MKKIFTLLFLAALSIGLYAEQQVSGVVVDSKGEQILPVSYSDNYFHLMPGEARTVLVEWNDADCQAPGLPKLTLTGFNTVGRELGLGSAN